MTKFIKWLLVVVALCGGGWAARQVYHARRAGAALVAMLERDWPTASAPSPRTRDSLFGAAEHMRCGRHSVAATELGSTQIDLEQRGAARRFFTRHADLRERLLQTVSTAENGRRTERGTADARWVLTRVLVAAARDDAASTARQLTIAEAALDPLMQRAGQATTQGANDVASRLARLEPAVRLGRQIMTEGYGVAERLMARAAWHTQHNQNAEACALLDMAAQLLSAPPSDVEGPPLPEWFLKMSQSPLATADPAQAQSAVQLAEAAAESEGASAVVRILVTKARCELDAARTAHAAWWASIALQAMALDGTAALDTQETEEDASR